MLRRILPLAGILVGALVLAPGSYASGSFGGCQLSGNATFKQPLGVNRPTPQPPPAGVPNVPPSGSIGGIDWGSAFSYTFDGDLSNCQAAGQSGPDATAPASGKIYAGEPIMLGGVKYDWPSEYAAPTGNGGCTGSHTQGTSVVAWADNSVSAISYNTDGVLAAVGLTGNFLSGSLTLKSAAKDSLGNPVSIKTVDLRYAHDYTGGPLAFQPPDPTACNGAGVTSAAINGVLGHGNAQLG